MKEILLHNGAVALVDDEDYESLSKYKWNCNNRSYASRSVTLEQWRNGDREHLLYSVVMMHRVIMDAPDGMDVDHKNHDRLDNRKSNLRICTRQQNLQNRQKSLNTKNKYKGVTRLSSHKWKASIYYRKKQKLIGFFETEEMAAKAYDEKAKSCFGEFACLNFDS
jgi:hypothetical protein